MSECECDLDNECALHRRIARLESERDALKAKLAEVKELSELRLKSEQKYAWGSIEFTNEIKTLKAELEREKQFALEYLELKSRAAKCELSAARYREALVFCTGWMKPVMEGFNIDKNSAAYQGMLKAEEALKEGHEEDQEVG